MRRRQDLHATGRAGKKRVDVPRDLAQIFAQRHDVRIPASEDQALVAFEPWYWRSTVGGGPPLETSSSTSPRPMRAKMSSGFELIVNVNSSGRFWRAFGLAWRAGLVVAVLLT